MSSRGRPILVTGCPRSGTTWVGSVLARATGLVYIHEPFNPVMAIRSPARFPHAPHEW